MATENARFDSVGECALSASTLEFDEKIVPQLSDYGELFPLSSTLFERYMIADDRVSHPMGAFMEIRVSGNVTRAVLLSTFSVAINRHPLLRAKIRYNLLGLPVWTLTSPHQPDVGDWNAPLDFPDGERLNLLKGPGLRTWIRSNEETTRIVIQVHHACSDAIGKLTFLADWLRIATGETLAVPDWERLRNRGDGLVGLPAASGEIPSRNTYSDLFHFLRYRTVSLSGQKIEPRSEAGPVSGLYSVSVDAIAFAGLRRDARELCVSVNDWLLAALHLAMESWTAAQGASAAGKVYRILMPFNLRSQKNVSSSASNQIGYDVVGHMRFHQSTFVKLCQEFSAFAKPIRYQRKSTFTRVLRALRPFSVLFPVVTRAWKKSFATVVFSNLGDVTYLFDSVRTNDGSCWTFGDLVVEQIQCAPPTRPGTHLSIVAMGYGGQLIFTTRCEGRVLASDSIRGFMNHFRETVMNLIAERVKS